MRLETNQIARTRQQGVEYFLLFFFIVLFFAADRALAVSTSNQSIEELLRQSQEALMKSPAPPQNPSANTHATKKRKLELSAEPVPDIPETPNASAQLTGVPPIDTSALEKVVRVDLQASQMEGKLIYPIAKLGFSGGMQSLRSGYSLMKDDDHFSNRGGEQLAVFNLVFNPTWRLRAADTALMHTYISGVVRFGYAQGNLAMERTGVHPSNDLYSVKIFPAEVGMQIELEFWQKVGMFMGYGPAMEIFHQDGVGVNDTITNVFYGDEVWIGLNGYISNELQLFLSYTYKGSRLLFRSSNIGGQVFAAGIMFNLFD